MNTKTEVKHKESYDADSINLNINFKITLPYDSFLVFEMPENCKECPYFKSNNYENCGLTERTDDITICKRPSSCKLRKVTPEGLKQLVLSNLELSGLLSK